MERSLLQLRFPEGIEDGALAGSGILNSGCSDPAAVRGVHLFAPGRMACGANSGYVRPFSAAGLLLAFGRGPYLTDAQHVSA